MGSDGHDVLLPTEWTHITVGILTAFSGAITTINQVSGHETIAAKHRTISNQYAMLAQNIRMNIHYPSRPIHQYVNVMKTIMELMDANKDLLVY